MLKCGLVWIAYWVTVDWKEKVAFPTYWIIESPNNKSEFLDNVKKIIYFYRGRNK